MKRFILILAFLARVTCAQDEISLSSAFGAGEGVNGEVFATAVQPDGKIVIGGRFSAVNGIARNNIARLNDDGTLDRTFAAEADQGVNGQVNALAVQLRGGIIVGGTFTQVGQLETANLARYDADGKVDQTFGGADAAERGTNGSVYALAVQPDGKIVVGGNFNTIFGQPRHGIARLNANGSVDVPLTAPNALSGTVRALCLTSEVSFVVAGEFTLSKKSARSLLSVPSP